MKKEISFLLFLLLTTVLWAAPLRDVPQTLIQPDGDTLHCFASGDEFFHYLHDANGYTIVQNPVTGYYVYAVRDGENIKASDYVAGKINPAQLGLAKKVLPSLRAIRRAATVKRQFMGFDQSGISLKSMANAPPSSDKNHGTMNNIVIFIRFNDDADTPFLPLGVYDNIFIAPGTSMQAYYEEVSYGQITIPSTYYPAAAGNTVMSYKDNQPRAYYQPYNVVTNPSGYKTDYERGVREQTLIKNAVNSITVPTSLNIDMNNDGKVDNITIIVTGGTGDWNDLLWPHRWVMSYANASINGKRVSDYIFIPDDGLSISTLCHETFHALGAPDLYHYDDGNRNLDPVYTWDVMGLNKTPPQHMGAYMKYKYGNWINEIPMITSSGTYTLHPVNSSDTNNCYKIPIPGTQKEYYVVEYRKKPVSGFESSIPNPGLLIYRINTNFNGNANYDATTVFDEVYIFRPNGAPLSDGLPLSANYSADVGRTSFNASTNPYAFLTDGTPDQSISILNISSAGETISFTVKYIDVTDVTITVPDIIPITEGKIHLTATVVPSDATNQKLLWSVVNGSGSAIVSGDSLLLKRTGYITLKTVSQSNPEIKDEQRVFIAEEENGNPVKMYWNSFDGINGLLDIENPEGISLTQLYSLSGTLVKEIQGTVNTTFMQISFSQLKRGLYILRTWNGNKTRVSSVKIMW